MSDQTEQTSGESGSPSAGVFHSADTPSEPATASEASRALADAAKTGSEPNVTERAAVAATTSETHASEAPKAETGTSAFQPEPPRPELSHSPGTVIVMSRGDSAKAANGTHFEAKDAGRHILSGNRRIAAMAALVALATTAGALGGALATSAFMRDGGSDVAANGSRPSLEPSWSRIDADIQALKSGLEHTSKLAMNQFNKTSERLDRLERTQAEPAAKIAKLSDAVEKLRAAPEAPPAVAAAVPAAAKEATGSISAAPTAPTVPIASAAAQRPPATPPKSEAGRLPTLEGWVLRDVAQGAALIDGRRGIYEVYAGDFIPGLGRIDAVRRQDGRWVVVTSRGLIVAHK